MASMQRRWKRRAETRSIHEQLTKLRHLMLEARDLGKIEHYFNTVVLYNEDFTRTRARSSHEILASLAGVFIRSLTGEGKALREHFVQLVGEGFWHGMLWYPRGTVAQVLYFQDVNRGLIAICTSSKGHFVRFSLPTEMHGPVEVESARLLYCGSDPKPGEKN